jgi:hypothetical protein
MGCIVTIVVQVVEVVTKMLQEPHSLDQIPKKIRLSAIFKPEDKIYNAPIMDKYFIIIWVLKYLHVMF